MEEATAPKTLSHGFYDGRYCWKNPAMTSVQDRHSSILTQSLLTLHHCSTPSSSQRLLRHFLSQLGRLIRRPVFFLLFTFSLVCCYQRQCLYWLARFHFPCVLFLFYFIFVADIRQRYRCSNKIDWAGHGAGCPRKREKQKKNRTLSWHNHCS